MNGTAAPVTLLVGPPTRLAHALNSIARRPGALAGPGLVLHPNRIVTRTLRALAKDGGDAGAVLGIADEGSVFLSAVYMLGPPEGAFHKHEIYPNAEPLLDEYARLLLRYRPRVIVTIEALHDFLFYLETPLVAQRTQSASWETLYEVGWADLVMVIADAFPGCDVLVVTPEAAFVQADRLFRVLFGEAGATLSPRLLQAPHLSEAGISALEALGGGVTEPDRLEAVLAQHRARPDPEALKARLGIDPLTARLLDDRLREDLARIDTLPGVRLF